MHEYGRFMRLILTFGTLGFLYKFGQTMAYMESEKRPESTEERAARRKQDREMREDVRQQALRAGSIVPPSNDHVRRVIEKVQGIS
jgi:hypothetical protein